MTKQRLTRTTSNELDIFPCIVAPPIKMFFAIFEDEPIEWLEFLG